MILSNSQGFMTDREARCLNTNFMPQYTPAAAPAARATPAARRKKVSASFPGLFWASRISGVISGCNRNVRCQMLLHAKRNAKQQVVALNVSLASTPHVANS